MHPKVKAYYNYIKENQRTQAELKESEKSWKDFSDTTEAFQKKVQAFCKNILELSVSPDASLYFSLLTQGVELIKTAATFSNRMSEYYDLQVPYNKPLKEMLDKITEASKQLNVEYPERTIKKCRAIEQQYMPGIKIAKEKIDEMQKQLLKEREELQTLYNGIRQ